MSEGAMATAARQSEPYFIGYNRLRLILILASVFVIPCVILPISFLDDLQKGKYTRSESLAHVAAAEAIGVLAVSYCWRRTWGKPALTLTAEGMFPGLFVAYCVVRWSDIADVFVHESLGVKQLGMSLLDERAFVARKRWYTRWNLRTMRLGLSGSLVAIPGGLLDSPIAEVIDHVRARVGMASPSPP